MRWAQSPRPGASGELVPRLPPDPGCEDGAALRSSGRGPEGRRGAITSDASPDSGLSLAGASRPAPRLGGAAAGGSRHRAWQSPDASGGAVVPEHKQARACDQDEERL